MVATALGVTSIFVNCELYSIQIYRTMDELIRDTESKLKEQQTILADKIRAAEDSLMRDKELYLKVTGALEGLAILQQRLEEEKDVNPASEDACSVNLALG